jgi:hypothetical protein
LALNFTLTAITSFILAIKNGEAIMPTRHTLAFRLRNTSGLICDARSCKRLTG